ncbi:phosphatidylinositol-3-phosphatase SAC1 [Anopheles ziemanni]|uniref:phosphatidylinositol-3-phosphatase SAC1 n=1 Tax=Anopheles coustani TaxID=139045 RepID=UPI002659D31B|nr:phosphatidylinositol-3-phosphatase SAC1 [Anopheles coustani]XP_058175731.1 phosphatidylinositol-3-phosphatase SAC1 [Anopheles ziemanni]
MEKPIYDDLRLYITPDRFYIEPQGVENEFIIIERLNGAISLHNSGSNEQIPLHCYDTRNICGVLGMIRLISGMYLVVVTHRIFVGLIDDKPIWQMAGFDLISLAPTLTHLSEEQKEQNSIYLSMVRQVLDTPFFYFSYSYDLTNTMQRTSAAPKVGEIDSIMHKSDKRFVWNVGLLECMAGSLELARYTLPIIHGFVSINNVVINDRVVSWILVSRRSVEHAGTRLFCRGINSEGQVANYVETEQILITDEDKVSFVQTRGSIPLFWQQMPNLKYKPRPQLLTGGDHLIACSRHFDDQCRRYGAQVLINLIDHKGAEDVLEKAFDAAISTLANKKLTYVSFDFHQECKKMRYDRLSNLIWRIAKDQDNFGVYHASHSGLLYSVQRGVFRTNCIDCLDRTNVVQSMIARRSLEQTLLKLGILRPGEHCIDPASHFETIFKAVWADNADLISLQYSGTGALKTDFTRTGKRTFRGMMRDGLNSLTRYVKNNFNDGFRQDSIELFLGAYRVADGEGLTIPSPLKNTDVSADWHKGAILASVLFEIAMLFVVLLSPAKYDIVTGGLLLAWSVMIGFTGRYIVKHRDDFVDWPKLVPKKKK